MDLLKFDCMIFKIVEIFIIEYYGIRLVKGYMRVFDVVS